MSRPRPVSIYVAGPMSGMLDYNRPAFGAAADQLRRAGYTVLSPVHDDDLNADGEAVHEWSWYLRRDLRILLDADAVALLPGWKNSAGATLERHVAEQLGMDIRSVAGWL